MVRLLYISEYALLNFKLNKLAQLIAIAQLMG